MHAPPNLHVFQGCAISSQDAELERCLAGMLNTIGSVRDLVKIATSIQAKWKGELWWRDQ